MLLPHLMQTAMTTNIVPRILQQMFVIVVQAFCFALI
jgi:hypothetical protein